MLRNAAGEAMTNDVPPLALYVHLPWCVRKCPYCDFNSHAASDNTPYAAYVAAILADLSTEAARAGGTLQDIAGGTALDRLDDVRELTS